MYKTWARSVPGACGGTVTGVATEEKEWSHGMLREAICN